MPFIVRLEMRMSVRIQENTGRVRQNDMIEARGIRMEQELRWKVHHKDRQRTSRYTNMAPEKD